MSKRRVVITGLGAVCSLGAEVETIFKRLLAGESGIRPITKFDVSKFDVRFAGEILGMNPEEYFPKTEIKRLDPFSQLALYAGDQAHKDSGIDFNHCNRERIGAILGTGIGGITGIEEQHDVLRDRGPSRITPFFIPKIMANASAGQMAIRLGIQGTNFVTSSACASSGHAIGLALRTIQYDEADAIFTGGSESAITPLGLGGFCAIKALSTRNDNPTAASRPFDKDRDGFVMGDGAAILLFEELEHAKKRGAKIYAEVLGFGSTDDAYHITAPDEKGIGPARAMTQAIQEAKISPDDIQYVNAHGTSTHYNDKIETLALKIALKEGAKKIAVSSTKSMVGHLLGASSAIELMTTALSIARDVAHPTINYTTPDPECDLDYIPNTAREFKIRNAISNSFGFGGHNVCIALGKVR